MDFLVHAGKQGYSVSADAINWGNERLLRYLQDPGMISIPYADNLEASKFTVQSYAALVSARQRRAPLGAPREIWEHRADATSGLPLLQLGIILRTMGGATRDEEVIVLVLKTPRNSNERVWLDDYGSPPHDDALMLSSLEENKLLPDEQCTLLNTLSQQAFDERWLSMQEGNALFLTARTTQDSLGRQQVQTSSSTEPLTDEKTLNSNLNSDQLATLQVRNSDDQPLWLCMGASGYPQSAPLSANNVLQIERHILGTDGKSRSLDSLHSDDLVLAWSQVKTSNSVPDALVMDLLPAGLGLENQNLANGSASLEQSGGGVQNLLNQMQQASIRHIEFHDDRFATAIAVDEYQSVALVYLAWAVTPGAYQVPQPMVGLVHVPQWWATGAAEDLLIIRP